MILYPQTGMKVKVLEGPWLGLFGEIVEVEGDKKKVVSLKFPDVFGKVVLKDQENMEQIQEVL